MKSFFPVILCSLIITASSANAQQAPESPAKPVKPVSSVYFELIGNGGFYSVNYDTRFNKRPDGFGGRVGLGYVALASDDDFEDYQRHSFTVPIGINYLAGKNGNYFEAGAGITYYSGNIYLIDNIGDSKNGESTNGVFGNLTFGYRKQPIDGGFTVRAGVSPIITKHSFIPYWPHLSFGYAF